MDYFALLDEPRQPWLDPAALKEKFLARGAEAHPDKFPDATEKAAAQAMPESLQLLEQVEAIQQKLRAQLDALDSELEAMNGAWEPDPPLEAAERLYHQYSYLGHWRDQLQDRALRLGL